jgi:hypothetical protein
MHPPPIFTCFFFGMISHIVKKRGRKKEKEEGRNKIKA